LPAEHARSGYGHVRRGAFASPRRREHRGGSRDPAIDRNNRRVSRKRARQSKIRPAAAAGGTPENGEKARELRHRQYAAVAEGPTARSRGTVEPADFTDDRIP
jgi:hypothetical protein